MTKTFKQFLQKHALIFVLVSWLGVLRTVEKAFLFPYYFKHEYSTLNKYILWILCETGVSILRIMQSNKMRRENFCELTSGIDNFLGSIFFKVDIYVYVYIYIFRHFK